MTFDQGVLVALIALIFAFLIWGRFRYDLVAFASLIGAAVAGVVPREQVFSGFGHPAVIIIALVLIVSRGLVRSGAVELLASRLIDSSRSLSAHIGILSAVSAAMSSVMNNVAALALLMPMEVRAAQRAKRSPALTLMPLSFATILGGMVTMIGTPPNIVIATFRRDAIGEAYEMFDFAPVGIVVAVTGLVFVALLGWRLIPAERTETNQVKELKELEPYVAEAEVRDSAEVVGKALRELEPLADAKDVRILGLARRGKRLPGAARREVVRTNDVVVFEGAPEDIDAFVGAAGLEYTGSEKHLASDSGHRALKEAVVPQGARIAGRSAKQVGLLSRQGVTLLGISRRGRRIREGVRQVRIQPGDVLLVLGAEKRLADVVEWLGCLPLAERGLDVIERRRAWAAMGIFVGAILLATAGAFDLPLALGAAVVAYVILRIVPLSQVYESIEWPVIVLLGSMIPIGVAFETSGCAAGIAETLVGWTASLPTIGVLAVLMIVTMTLSDVFNNVATALITAPIALDVASRLDANPDSFLMAVAVAASCAFLTPIGHKNNTIILGPGGYEFGDYWRMGLPLEVLVVLVSVPMIVTVWPL